MKAVFFVIIVSSAIFLVLVVPLASLIDFVESNMVDALIFFQKLNCAFLALREARLAGELEEKLLIVDILVIKPPQ